MRLAQISDLHIVTPGQLLLGRIDTAAFLARCVARLATLVPRPDAVLVTGDLVDQGTTEEYEALRALLAPLPMPVYLMLGNHDDRAAFRAVFGAAPYLEPAAPTEFVQYAFSLGEVTVLALDTNDPGRPGGRLCEARRAWLERALAAARGRPVVIAMHHPPFSTGIPFMDACGLDRTDAAALAEIVARHPNIERVICGHLHRQIQARFGGTVATTAPSCGHAVALTLDAGPPSFVFEPPALVLHAWVEAGPERALVSHHVYIDPSDGPYPFTGS